MRYGASQYAYQYYTQQDQHYLPRAVSFYRSIDKAGEPEKYARYNQGITEQRRNESGEEIEIGK
ncbi:MAG: hypothetical protein Q7R34_09890, partial [Dehalococcoidia bacterium]|nr:hypothetical protein [Dehalococcoidia bacterium]